MIIRKIASTMLPKGTSQLNEPSTTPKAAGYKRFADNNYAPPEDTLPVQGRIGNCWLIAPMLASQLIDSNYFSDKVYINTAENWARVLLNVNGRKKWVKVSLNIPVNADGSPVYARAVRNAESTKQQKTRREKQNTVQQYLWPGLIEKAVAKEIGAGYSGIARGFGIFGFSLLTGAKSRTIGSAWNLKRLSQLLDSGYAVVASTHPLSTYIAKKIGGYVPANAHVMAVESVDLKNGRVTIRNQWDPNTRLEYTDEQFKLLFISFEAAKI